jgi:hypothetical protein
MNHPRRALLLSVQNWPQACRLPKYLRLGGFAVAACTPKSELLNLSSSLDSVFELPQPGPGQLEPTLQQILAACRQWHPHVLLPCDDLSADVLDRLFLRVQSDKPADAVQLQQLLIDSRGHPTRARLARSKHHALAWAHDMGLFTPAQHLCHTQAELPALVKRTGYPVVLKGEYGVAGLGVVICHSESDLGAAWTRASMAGTVAVQQHIGGRPAFCTAASWRGRLISANAFEVIQAWPEPVGPSTVIRHVQHEAMLAATRTFVERTGCSGIVSLDFILTPEDRACFLECNPRPVPATHLGHGLGNDLFAALHAAMTGRAAPATPAASGQTIALFPKEYARDPASPWLWKAWHDVPWDEPAILRSFLYPAK